LGISAEGIAHKQTYSFLNNVLPFNVWERFG